MSRWKIVVAVAVGLLLLAGFWMARTSVDPAKDVDAYKQWLVAHGEKLEISQVLPPPVPPDQNGADILNEAFRMLMPEEQEWTNSPEAMTMIGPAKAIVCFEQPDVRGLYFTNSWSNVTAFMDANRPATELLRQLIDYPSIDFHFDYNSEEPFGWDAFREIRSCPILWAEAICDLRTRDAASATTNICAMLAIVNGEQGDRLIESQDSRRRETSLAAAANWELLQSTNVNDDELAMLQRSWERLEFIHAMENALLMQRAMTDAYIMKLRASPVDYGRQDDWSLSGDWNDVLHNYWCNIENIYGVAMWRVSWTYSDELQMLKIDQLILNTTRAIETNGCFNPAYSKMMSQLDPMKTAIRKNNLDQFRWPFSNPYLGFVLSDTMAAEAIKRMAIAAIALKRYQLKHGNYPATLSALSPEFLPSVPLDPVDGKPLRYQRNDDGTFLLYSIGENGKDDGGDSSDPQNPNFNYWLDPGALDWVWPQPATEAEIQDFYNHHPK